MLYTIEGYFTLHVLWPLVFYVVTCEMDVHSYREREVSFYSVQHIHNYQVCRKRDEGTSCNLCRTYVVSIRGVQPFFSNLLSFSHLVMMCVGMTSSRAK